MLWFSARENPWINEKDIENLHSQQDVFCLFGIKISDLLKGRSNEICKDYLHLTLYIKLL